MLFAMFLWIVVSMQSGMSAHFVSDPLAYVPWIVMEVLVFAPYMVGIKKLHDMQHYGIAKEEA